ncbi:MAG: DUF2191 domain-containing protein [Cyclobacteriaceae bacterium]|nr:DUF2191 domain-containing protein [Cyclobacteriaceae bacterium]
MKLTAIIPDELIEEIKTLTGGKNITESVIIAMREYINQKKINSLIDNIQKEPVVMEDSAAYIRKLNRNR